MIYWSLSIALPSIVAVALLSPDAALAQASDGSALSAQLDEVVVTARRTTEKLQTTPVAVTALIADVLTKKQITDLISLQYSVPNLVVGQNAAGQGNTVSLRGQLQPNALPNYDQSVGLYADGVYSARQAGALLDLIDIEQVEVLRGPQGTLFGRNSTGGAISITSKKPTGDFGGYVKLGLGNFDQRRVLAVLNVPVREDELALRFVMSHKEHSGYGRNEFLNLELGDENSDYFRASLRAAPTDKNWTIDLTGDYSKTKGNGQITVLHAVTPTAAIGFLPVVAPITPGDSLSNYMNAGFYSNFANFRPGNSLKSWGGSATIAFDFGDATLKSITGVRGYTLSNDQDFDSTPYGGLGVSLDQKQHQVSQELQLYGVLGPLSWIGGLYYFRENAENANIVKEGVFPINTLISNILEDVTNTSYAAYAQGNYNLNEQLRLTIGLRYTKDKRRIEASNFLTGGPQTICDIPAVFLDSPGTCTALLRANFDYLSYTAGMDYQLTSSAFLYVKTSLGHKSGGLNADTIITDQPFDPEKLTDYEAGAKIDLFDRRLRVNADVFYSDYRKMQRAILVQTTVGAASLVQSIGKAHIQGLEVEVAAKPVSALELSANLGLIDAKYDEFRDGLGADLSDQPFTNTSKVTFGAAATYTGRVSFGSYTLHVDYGYNSKRYYFATPLTLQPGYGLVNARATLALDNPDLELEFWARNIGSKKYNGYLLDFSSALGFVTGYRGDPRTYGVSVTWRFGG